MEILTNEGFINSSNNHVIKHTVEKSALNTITSATVLFTLFTLPNHHNEELSVNDAKINQLRYNNYVDNFQNKIFSDTTLNQNIVIDPQKEEETMSEKDTASYRDLDSVKETFDAKLDTVNTKIDNLTNSVNDVKNTLDSVVTNLSQLPSKEFVESKINGALLKAGGTAVVIIGLIIAYLEWRFV